MIKSCDVVANSLGKSLLITQGFYDPVREKNAIDSLLSHQCSGLIIHAMAIDDAVLSDYMSRFHEIVLVNRILKGYEDRCVNIEYLIKNGHKKIAFLNSSFDIIDAHQRKEGYLEAMKAHHLEVNEELMLSVPPSLEGGAQAAEKLLQVLKKDKNAFTAIACYSDTIAASAMSIFENRGIKVPEEVSFTGFDDLFLSSCLSPALTTVRNPIDDMGKNALLLSLDRASGENKFKISPFKTELIVRKSVTDLSKRS